MQFLNNEKWIVFLNKICENTDYKESKKGEQFEYLVSLLLKKLFPNKKIEFKPTKKTHDGSKDFWGFDEEKNLWWAECKNYSDNISISEISPTLFIAELYEVNYLMLFSYSKLNKNLLRKAAFYCKKHNKKIFVFDDNCLERIIETLLPTYFYSVIGSADEHVFNNNNFICDFFAEKNPKFFDEQSFDGYYDITSLNTKDIYNINALVKSESSEPLNIKINIKENKDNSYFSYINKSDSTIALIEPYELTLITYSIKLLKAKPNISIPKLSLESNSQCEVLSTYHNYYKCINSDNYVLVGENYERIITKASETIIDKNKIGVFLIYGPSGTGKTRILDECYPNLIKSNYNTMNFVGFDNTSGWKDVVCQIIYSVFSIPDIRILDIISEYLKNDLNDEIKNNNCEVYDMLRIIYNDSSSFYDIEKYLPLIFEKIVSHKYAFIIDNFQSYSDELVCFFTKMIDYCLQINRKYDLCLLFSINTDLVYSDSYSTFISRLLSIETDSQCFYSEKIRGFDNYSRALTFLNNKLNLSEFPLYEPAKEKIIQSTSLRPKYIEQAAKYIINYGCITTKSGKNYINNTKLFEKCINEIPDDYYMIFRYNYSFFIKSIKGYEVEIERIISVMYLLGQLTSYHIKLFDFSAELISKLEAHGYIKNEGSHTNSKYIFDHDLTEKSFASYYDDSLKTAAKELFNLDGEQIKSLKLSKYILQLCDLIINTHPTYDILNSYNETIIYLPNRLKSIYAESITQYVLCSNTITDLECFKICRDICVYINDHINIEKAEILFDICEEAFNNRNIHFKKVMEVYFSFCIHRAENKIHLSKPSEAIIIYNKLLNDINELENKNNNLKKECDYARAYISNRIFVCGKIENDIKKYIFELESSKKICETYHFYDILFENYFDESNIYFEERNIDLFVTTIKKGFRYYNESTEYQKAKFKPNYYSKKLKYLCCIRDYLTALELSNKALLFLVDNNRINYHLFFKERFLYYKLICLFTLHEQDIGSVLDEYEAVLLSMGVDNSLKLLFFKLLYSYFINDSETYKYYFEQLYLLIGNNCNRKYTDAIKNLAILYRKQIKEFDKSINYNSLINSIIFSSDEDFKKLHNNYTISAFIIDTNNEFGFYF